VKYLIKPHSILDVLPPEFFTL